MGIGYDAGIGLQTWASGHSGAPWNHVQSFPIENLQQPVSWFNAMFSPGQYLLPGLLADLGLPIGWASLLVVVACSFLGLAGYARLYRQLGFPEGPVEWCLLAIVCSRIFGYYFGIYLGGEPLIFAGFPWFCLASNALLERRWGFLLWPLLFLAGSFLKLSFVIAGLAVLAGYCLRPLFLPAEGAHSLPADDAPTAQPEPERPTPQSPALSFARPHLLALFRRGALCSALFLFSYWALHRLYLSHGWTAAESTRQWKEPFKNLLLVLGNAPVAWFSGFDLIDLFGFNHGGLRHEFTGHPFVYLLFALLSLLSLFLLWQVWRRNPNPHYRATWLGFALVSLPLFIYLFSNAGSWYEERHLRPLSYLLLPGIAVALHQVRAHRQAWVGVVFLMLTLGYSLGSFAVNVKRRLPFAQSDRTRFTQWNMDDQTLQTFHGLADLSQPGQALFVSDLHTVSIEVMPHRFTRMPLADALAKDGSSTRGQIPHLIIHQSRKNFDLARTKALLSRLVDLPQWFVLETPTSLFFHGGTAPPPQLPGWQLNQWRPITVPDLDRYYVPNWPKK